MQSSNWKWCLFHSKSHFVITYDFLLIKQSNIKSGKHPDCLYTVFCLWPKLSINKPDLSNFLSYLGLNLNKPILCQNSEVFTQCFWYFAYPIIIFNLYSAYICIHMRSYYIYVLGTMSDAVDRVINITETQFMTQWVIPRLLRNYTFKGEIVITL